MKRKILITAGGVYSPLDDNKLISNRTRGIWAARFARWLFYRGHQVTLLCADIHRNQISEHMADGPIPPEHEWAHPPGSLDIVTHKGFWDYQDQCLDLAAQNDAAVMAAAVINWIPKKPIAGKMSTTSIDELERALGNRVFSIRGEHDTPIPGQTIVNIPFILAPRVIDEMRRINPKLTLIGCKLTIGESRETMLEAAYKTLTGAKCHAVVANDMNAARHGLRAKTVLYPDQANFDFDVGADEGVSFYKHLEVIITDEHFTTLPCGPCWVTEKQEYVAARALFDRIVAKYQTRFVRKGTTDKVFGAVAVRLGGGALCSPREKGGAFSSKDAVDVAPLTADDIKNRHVFTVGGSMAKPNKATMNVPLLLRHLDTHPSAAAVLHLHEQLPNVPTVPYAPPGTVRDNLREIVGQVYNIEGHGCIVSLDDRGEMFGRWKK